MKFFRSCRYAWRGIGIAWKQNNFRLQVLAAAIVIIAGWLFSFNWIRWMMVVIVICLVLMAEMFNTAMERLLDVLEPRLHDEVRTIKDMLAGAVLVVVLGAIVIGLLMFLTI
ncbi:MAG: diacylglycerol kinase family protein [bacterium]